MDVASSLSKFDGRSQVPGAADWTETGDLWGRQEREGESKLVSA